MPRAQRYLPAEVPTHLVQRAVDRRTIFEDLVDFRTFLEVLGEAGRRFPVGLLGYCIMPNHWHLVAQGQTPGGISRYMQWLTSTHAVRHRKRRRTVGLGHVYQGRFWSAPIEGERHFLNVLRYVEANAVRAGLAPRAEHWRWSSAWERETGDRALLARLPDDLPPDWCDLLNTPLADPDGEAVGEETGSVG
jgi:putative transposase